MLFSVIIPVYNVEKYIKECLDSIVNQTFTDYEVILVDDGSTDNSGVVCDQYEKQYNHFHVLHQKNAGVSCARNAGLKLSKGTYIVFLDSDDYILDRKFLEKLSKKCVDKPDIILYGYKKFFESNQSFGVDICKYPNIRNIDNPGIVIKVLLKADMYDGSPWGKAIRTELLKSNHIVFLPGIISEDSDWYLQVVSCTKTYDSINEAFIAYRQREGSISHAPKIKSLTDNIDMLERWQTKIQELELSVELKEALMSVLARYYANILILYTAFPARDVKKYYAKMEELSHLLKYSVTSRSKIIKCTSCILGIRITIVLLSLLGKLKRRM